MKTYTLYELLIALKNLKKGDFFKIKGQLGTWEFWTENEGFFFVRNTTTKQKILLEKR